MKTPDLTAFDDGMLGELASLFATVNNQVLSDKSPTAFSRKWIAPPKKFYRPLTNRLYRWLYSPGKNWVLLMLISIGLALLLMLVINAGRWSPFLAFLMSLIMVIPPLWTYYDLSFNEPLRRELQIFTRVGMSWVPILLVVSLFYFAAWNIRFSPLDTAIRLLDEAMATSALWVFAIATAYYAAISFAIYLLIRLISSGVYYVVALMQWLLLYHALDSTEDLEKLLAEPLNVPENGSAARILDLDRMYVDALQEWAMLRRQLIQDKLIPTTLVLAVLGILANTSLGDWAFNWFVGAFRGNLDAGAVIIRLVILGLAIVLPARTIGILLSEAYATGVIAQACLLIQRARTEEPDSSSSRVEDDTVTPALPGWLVRIKRMFV